MDILDLEYEYEGTKEETNETPKVLKGNVSPDEIRSDIQALLYMLVDKSISIINNDIEEDIRQGLKDIKKTIKDSKREDCVQTAMTFFSSTLDMRPFQNGDCIDTSYEVDGDETHLFDAIVESSNNMIAQYDALKSKAYVQGVMFIFTDGQDNGSKYSIEKVVDYIEKLKDRNIHCIYVCYKASNVSLISWYLRDKIYIVDSHSKMRRLLKQMLR